MAQRHPDRAEAFLLRALETAHALGCSILGGVTYSALGFRSGEPPTEEEYANIARALTLATATRPISSTRPSSPWRCWSASARPTSPSTSTPTT